MVRWFITALTLIVFNKILRLQMKKTASRKIKQRPTKFAYILIVLFIILAGIITSVVIPIEIFKGKARTVIKPLIPTSFEFVSASYVSGILVRPHLKVIYKAKGTKENANSDVIQLIRKNKYRADRSSDHQIDSNSAAYVDIVNKHERDINVQIFDKNETSEEKKVVVYIYRDWFDPEWPENKPEDPPITVPSQILLKQSGIGNGTTQKIVTRNDWDLYWEYDCSNIGKADSFRVDTYFNGFEYKPNEFTEVSQHGTKQYGINDHGIQPADFLLGKKGDFYFKITTKCKWDIYVKG